MIKVSYYYTPYHCSIESFFFIKNALKQAILYTLACGYKSEVNFRKNTICIYLNEEPIAILINRKTGKNYCLNFSALESGKIEIESETND